VERTAIMKDDDETALSEITILPDGRMFVLGASRQLLEVLEILCPNDATLEQRLKQAGATACDSHSIDESRELLDFPHGNA
jgi:hypothetical protein